jgi:diaminopimelate decarboxylase
MNTMCWWENSFLKAKKGRLYIDGKEAIQIAEHYGTPLYVYSTKQLLSNYRSLRESFAEHTSLETRICYAMKANAHPGLLVALKNEGAWIDAVSPGEVQAALDVGFPEERILYTGTSVGSQDLMQVFKRTGVVVTIDAYEQLELMKEIRDLYGSSMKSHVAVRWNPGLGIGFHPKVITAGMRSTDGTPIKFGVEDERVISTFTRAVAYGFKPLGLHQHLGSGWIKQDFQGVMCAVDKMIAKASELQKAGFSLEFLDFGGGFGPRYSEEQQVFPVLEYVKSVCQKIAQSDLDIRAVAIEPGKYLVGDAGVLLLKVEYLKESYGNLFACVNAGTFNTVPRPAIYNQAQHHIINCSNVPAEDEEKITVAGNLCETGDVFGRDVRMSLPRRGDVLALLCAGAYCRSMASHFNLREIPEEVLF